MDNTNKQCVQCGTLNPVSANFCKTCGSNNFVFAESSGVDNETGNSEVDIDCIENPVNEQPTKSNKPKEINLVKVFLSGIAGILAIIIAVVVIGKIPQKVPVDNDGVVENVVSELTSTTPSTIKKTVMVYLVGSDLESQSGAASMDIVEMMESGVDTSKNNILVYTGGTKQWFIEDIPATQNSIYKLENGEFSLVKSLESLNMGDSSTLTEFLNYGVTNHSADSYGLILWNHGAGPMIGYGVDEVHGDLLEMSEITNALSRAGFGNELKLEFLGFDACLMGSIETAWTIKDYAEFLIASQETEPGTGWDYAFMEKLNYYDEGNHIGQAIIDSYFSGYEEIVSQYPQFEADLTLSCMNLSKIDDVEDGLNLLFKEVDSNILSGSFQQTSKCRYETNVKKFKDCKISELDYSFSEWNNCTIELAKGLVLEKEKTVAQDVIDKWGEPTENRTSEYGTTLEYIKEENVMYSIYFDETGYLVNFKAENQVVDESDITTNAERPAYLDDYKAPTKLTDDPLSYTFRLDGAFYTFPAPVSEFVKNGWEITAQAESVPAQREVLGGIRIRKNGCELLCGIKNFADVQVSAEDSMITSFNYSSYYRELDLELSGGIKFGISEDDFKRIINIADFECTTYENGTNHYGLAGLDFTRHAYFDFSEDGKLDGINFGKDTLE